jgi:hypothetical protein
MQTIALESVDRAIAMLNGLLESAMVDAGEGLMLVMEEADFTQVIASATQEAVQLYGERITGAQWNAPMLTVFDPAAVRRVYPDVS